VRTIGAILRIGGDRASQSPSTGHILLTREHGLHGRTDFTGTAFHEIGFLTSSPGKADGQIPRPLINLPKASRCDRSRLSQAGSCCIPISTLAFVKCGKKRWERSVCNLKAIQGSRGVSMKVFLNWSGETSRHVAIALHDWLLNVIQAIERWMSSEGIAMSAQRSTQIASELANR
jgi:hypothetical protein